MNVTVPQGRELSKSGTISASGTKTGALDLGGFTLCGVILPATFTGVALTFEMSDAVDGTFVAVKKSDGNALSYVVAQGTYAAIDPKDFHGINFLKIVSGSTEGSARTLKLMLKGF